MSNVVSINYGFMLIPILYFTLILGLVGLGVYFIISTLRFYKSKTKHDRELLDRLDELISLKKEQNEMGKS